jgi:hypothetical protein
MAIMGFVDDVAKKIYGVSDTQTQPQVKNQPQPQAQPQPQPQTQASPEQSPLAQTAQSQPTPSEKAGGESGEKVIEAREVDRRRKEACPICGKKVKRGHVKAHIRWAHEKEKDRENREIEKQFSQPPSQPLLPPKSPAPTSISTPAPAPALAPSPSFTPQPTPQPSTYEPPLFKKRFSFNLGFSKAKLQGYIFQRRGDTLEFLGTKEIKLKKDKTGVYIWQIGKVSLPPIPNRYIQPGNKVFLEYLGAGKYTPLQLKYADNPGEVELVNPFAKPEMIMDYNLYRLSTERIYKSKPGMLQQLLPFLLIFAFTISIVIVMFGAGAYLGPIADKIHSDAVRLAELAEKLGLFKPAPAGPPG